MPLHLGVPYLILMLVMLSLVFGVGKLPQAGSTLDKAIREFRKWISGDNTSNIAKPEA